MLLLLTSLIFQKVGRYFCLYSTACMSPSSLPCTGFSCTGRKKCHRFQLFFYKLIFDAAEVQGQLLFAPHFIWKHQSWGSGDRKRWVHTATIIFIHRYEPPTCVKLRKPWCAVCLMALRTTPAWTWLAPSRGQEHQYGPEINSPVPAATRLVGNGGIHWVEGVMHRIILIWQNIQKDEMFCLFCGKIPIPML